MCDTVALSVSRARAPTRPATTSRRSLRSAEVSRTVRALPPTGSVVTSVRSSRLSSFGGSSATPWEAIVRRNSTGSPFGPFSGISSASAIGDTCHILRPLRRGAGSGRYFCAPFCVWSAHGSLHAFEPGFRLEAFEGCPCFGEHRFRVVYAAFAGEPFAVLGQRDGEIERHSVLAEDCGRSSEPVLRLRSVAVLRGEAGAVAGGVCTQARREDPGWQRLDCFEHVLCPITGAERQCRLARLRQGDLHRVGRGAV